MEAWNINKLATPVIALANFYVKYLEKGKCSTLLFLPQDTGAEIGSIVARLGMFEHAFDACLTGLIAGEQNDGGTRNTELSRRQNFKRRRNLFCAICKKWLAEWKPNSASALKALIDRSGHLAKKRNLIALGTYPYSIKPSWKIATNCRAMSNEMEKQFEFYLEALEKLRQDISHQAADLLIEFQKFGAVEGMPAMIADTAIQRIYRDTEHTWHPNPAKRTNIALE